MKIRAVMFDVYGTLLEVGPPPADADARWELLWEETLKAKARLDLAGFAAACDAVIAREHAAARAAGIPFPEVYWPDIAGKVLPELACLSAAALDDFLFRQAQLWHAVRISAEAVATLVRLRSAGLLLGLASNCQPYTLRELDAALEAVGMSRAIFATELCFFSFQAGFSKPDPHGFRLLTARLHALGIAPGETLMVGDREDNDILPARAQGWQTWLLAPPSCAASSGTGDWQQLLAWLRRNLRPTWTSCTVGEERTKPDPTTSGTRS